MARRVQFKKNSAGIRKLLNSRTAERSLEAPGERVLAAARASAPVGKTGRYRNSLHAEFDRTDRVVLRIGSDVEYAIYLEAQLGILGKALGNR